MAADNEFPAGTAFVDGEYRPMSEAKVSVLDWGFLRSDATYDVVHVWQGRFFRLDAHIDRFLSSVEKLRMALPVDRARRASAATRATRSTISSPSLSLSAGSWTKRSANVASTW
jgi:branched-subunit amino acid aminotransferase/4-amino-4-deoxychorismate lyase